MALDDATIWHRWNRQQQLGAFVKATAEECTAFLASRGLRVTKSPTRPGFDLTYITGQHAGHVVYVANLMKLRGWAQGVALDPFRFPKVEG